MYRKVLTHLIIITLAILPVQLISANVENLNMQMSMHKSMGQQTQASNECLHDMTEQNSINKSCCDDQSHDCQNCNNCPQAVSALFLPSYPLVKTSSLKTQKFIISYLFLNSVPQKNLLRPPRTLI